MQAMHRTTALGLARALACCWLAWLMMLSPAGSAADNPAAQGPAQEEFIPKSEKGPVVIVLSGQTGPANYRNFSKQMAGAGYYTVLIDGKDILTRQQDGAQNLRTVIARAQASPNA